MDGADRARPRGRGAIDRLGPDLPADAQPAAASAEPHSLDDREDTLGARPSGYAQVPWSVRDVAGGTLLFFLSLAAQVVILIAVIRQGGARPTGLGLTLSTVLSTLLTEGSLLILVVAYGIRRRARPVHFGIRPFASWVMLVAGGFLIAGFWVNLLYAAAIRIFGWERLTPPSARDLLPLFGEGGWGLAIGLVLAGVVAPVTEELFFRGFLFGGLRRPLGLIGAMFVSGLIFSVVHLQPATILPIFALGCLLAFLYEISKSLVPVIIMHATYNTIALVVAYVAATNL